jgi:hypothetical protein
MTLLTPPNAAAATQENGTRPLERKTILSPRRRGSQFFSLVATPPSLRKKRGAQVGQHSFGPAGLVSGHSPSLFAS